MEKLIKQKVLKIKKKKTSQRTFPLTKNRPKEDCFAARCLSRKIWIIFKDYSTLGVRYRDLQARNYEKETRNLTLHEAQPSAVLNFEFLVCKRVLVNPDNSPTKSAANVLIFSLSKPLKYMHFNCCVKIVKLYQKEDKTIFKNTACCCSFVLVSVASEIIVSISSKVKIIIFYTRPPFYRTIKISCTVISHGRALLLCKRNARCTIQPIRTLVYEN